MHIAAAWNFRGVIRERTGRYTDALREYEEAVRLAPDDADFQYSLAQFLRSVRRNSAGMATGRSPTRRVLASLPGGWSRDPIALLAAAHAEAGDFPEAVKMQEKAIGMATSDADKKDYDQRLALYRAGKPFEAKREK